MVRETGMLLHHTPHTGMDGTMVTGGGRVKVAAVVVVVCVCEREMGGWEAGRKERREKGTPEGRKPEGRKVMLKN